MVDLRMRDKNNDDHNNFLNFILLLDTIEATNTNLIKHLTYIWLAYSIEQQ